MDTNKSPNNRIHPLMALAAVSVIVVSLVGAAAITGLLPTSHSSTSATVPALPAPSAATTAAAGTSSPTVSSLADGKLAVEPFSHSSVKQSPSMQHNFADRFTTRRYHRAHTNSHSDTDVSAQAASTPGLCGNCGKVDSVQVIQHPAKPSGVGVVAGAVLGGVLGNQVGGGNGRTLATVAGAVGGGYAGNEVEKRSRSTTTYQVLVRMDDGSMRTFRYPSPPSWNAGDRVRVVNGSLTAHG